MELSHGFLFCTSTFIHEFRFACFTLAVLVAALRYRESKQPRYLMLASASVALLGATKETWVITVAVWLIALPCTWAYFHLRNRYLGRTEPSSPPNLPAKAASPPTAPQTPSSPQTKIQLYLTAATVFAAVWALFYFSFFI